VFLGALYLMGFGCEFLAPYSLEHRNVRHAYAPPQRIHLFDDAGGIHWPFVYELRTARHPETLARHYEIDHSKRWPIQFFVQGDEYHFLGLFRTELHLFGVAEGGTIHLLGTDSLGRDLFSRILYGARISLTIGLVGMAMSFVLGLIFGTMSGYFGGMTDHIIQRLIEMLRSFPSIPLWMGLAAAVPATWSPLQTYFAITVVLAFLGWTTLAREVRGKILSLREEDYAQAARAYGAGPGRIMFGHLLPGCVSHIIVSLTLSIPTMILGETALSFLGLGLRPPVTSWGVLLKECQNVQAVEMHPWLLTPAIFVIITVLAFNFTGDGLRDAADPYAT
jgi:peptide/nickel transport system permease protein